LIRRDEQRLATLITTEQGKRLPESLQEVRNCADTFEWMAEEGKRVYGRIVAARTPDTDQFVRHEPVGPVAAFSPWNFPGVLATRKIATALAAGCTVVLKPAEETPGIMVEVARLCIEAGVPKGALNLLYGDPAQVSSQLIAHPAIRKISFTGSVPVGQQLAAQAAGVLKKATLELGGHAPVLVTGDVDVDRVVELTLAAKFRNAGQLCLCPTRFFVHASVYDGFVARLGERAAALRVGNGLDADVQMGPLANPRRVEAMHALCEDAATRGARIVAGGCTPPGQRGGYFWQPTVIADISDDAMAMTREPFGPLALVTPFARLDDAILRANATEFGLAAYVLTNDIRRAHRVAHAIDTGMCWINSQNVRDLRTPFGGVKASGIGREGGDYAFDFYCDVEIVHVALGTHPIPRLGLAADDDPEV
jgi:succinate-semialdehyde dehydrogenase / glutarate-semialdehyde dehydrogenase